MDRDGSTRTSKDTGNVDTKIWDNNKKRQNDADCEKERKAWERSLCVTRPCLQRYFFICCTLILCLWKMEMPTIAVPREREEQSYLKAAEICDCVKTGYQTHPLHWLYNMHLENQLGVTGWWQLKCTGNLFLPLVRSNFGSEWKVLSLISPELHSF